MFDVQGGNLLSSKTTGQNKKFQRMNTKTRTSGIIGQRQGQRSFALKEPGMFYCVSVYCVVINSDDRSTCSSFSYSLFLSFFFANNTYSFINAGCSVMPADIISL